MAQATSSSFLSRRGSAATRSGQTARSASRSALFLEDGYLWINAPGSANAYRVDEHGNVRKVEKRKPTPKPDDKPNDNKDKKNDPNADDGGTGRTDPKKPPPKKPPPPAKPGAPSPPTNVTASASDGSVVAAWSSSLDNGSPITGYEVQWTNVITHKKATTSTEEDELQKELKLENGKSYDVEVRAINAVGPSGWVLARPRRLHPRGTSRSRRKASRLTSTEKDGTVDVSWKRPAGDGEVDQYVISYVEQGEGGATAVLTTNAEGPSFNVPTVSPLSGLTGVVLGKRYVFEVLAVNVRGDGTKTRARNPAGRTRSSRPGRLIRSRARRGPQATTRL